MKLDLFDAQHQILQVNVILKVKPVQNSQLGTAKPVVEFKLHKKLLRCAWGEVITNIPDSQLDATGAVQILQLYYDSSVLGSEDL